MTHVLIVHTATLTLGKVEQIVTASLNKQEVLSEAQKLRREHPGRKVKYDTIVERVDT